MRACIGKYAFPLNATLTNVLFADANMLGIMRKGHSVSILNTPSSKLATLVHIKIPGPKQSSELSQACLNTKDVKISTYR